MNLITRAALLRAAFPQISRHQIRTLSSQNKPKKLPEEITITLSTCKLFEGQNVNRKYIDTKINEGLKQHLPKKITVKKSSFYNSPSSQPTVYSQPSTSDSNDFLLYYLLFRDLTSDNHHHSSVDYHYGDSSRHAIEECRSPKHEDNDRSIHDSHSNRSSDWSSSHSTLSDHSSHSRYSDSYSSSGSDGSDGSDGGEDSSD